MALTKSTIWAASLTAGAAISSFSAQSNSLNWQQAGGFRAATLPVPASGKTGFRLLPPAVTGINFTNTLPEERAIANANLMNGSGVALGDYDGDAQMDRRAIAHGHARPLDASAVLARPEEAAEKASECKICQNH